MNLGQTYKRAQLSPLFQPAVTSQASIFHRTVCVVAFLSVGTVAYIDFWFVKFEVGAVYGKTSRVDQGRLLDVLV